MKHIYRNLKKMTDNLLSIGFRKINNNKIPEHVKDMSLLSSTVIAVKNYLKMIY